ncbi:MAG: amidohydrolase family protein [Chloroflexota bacterium]
MPTVDSQVHIWTGGAPTNPTHRQVHSFTADELLREMDAAGVDAALIHPPGWDPNANELATAAALAHPTRLAIMGNFDLTNPDNRPLVQDWLSRPGQLGLRFTFLQPHQRSWPTDGTIDWLWPAAQRAGVPVAIHASTFLPTVGQIAQRHPGLKLIVDHLGGIGGTGFANDPAALTRLPELLALAKHQNVAVKATGAPFYSRESYPFRDIHPYLKAIFEAFGPRRFFWGTDITRIRCSWRECVTLYTEELPWLGEADKRLVMGQAVCDWLGWKLAS